MARMSKQRVRGLAILVIFVALAYAGLTTQKQRDIAPRFDQILRGPNAQYRDSGSLNKATVKVRCTDISSALQNINSIIDSYIVAGERPLLKSTEPGYGVYIFRVRGAMVPDLVKKLSALGNIEEHKEIVDTALVTKKLSTEESILADKREELSLLGTMTTNFGDLSAAKNKINEEIRQLENTVDILRQADTTLLYVQLLPVIGRNISIVNRFLIQLGKALLVIFFGIIIAYYGTKLLMYLLTLMGVKGLPTSMSGTSGSYGYGNYANRYYNRYGYGSGKRKVKRIYKGKPTTPPEGEDNKQAPSGK